MGAAVAVAAIPDEVGMIHGCVKTSGDLRVIDSEAGQTCKRGETALNWNQRGPATSVRTAAGFGPTTAGCDGGDPATGGGVSAGNPPPSAVRVSKPEFQSRAQPTGWFGVLTDNGPVEVSAVCADVTP
jgi:hypothetical protein